MRIISRAQLRECWNIHPISKSALESWYYEVKHAEWGDWTDIKRHFPKVSPVGNDRYVFDIKGNDFRLVALIKFKQKIVYIRFVGTHKEYNGINAGMV
ncbi:type II toxin-antitoxin system HigB family toxin [Pseudodesulfovibrio sp.]|uniref:type II toxin-antitoxin system HigB family toxin n=1 Tax=Pseudodesulfovibrio sp. TaxID=2035812 RepID=UPI00343CE549